MLFLFSFTETDFLFLDRTVTVQDAFFPLEDVAVIFAVPDFFPFILPFFTDTTEGFELLQARVSVVSAGKSFAVNVWLFPFAR